jgi:hypothetical protein
VTVRLVRPGRIRGGMDRATENDNICSMLKSMMEGFETLATRRAADRKALKERLDGAIMERKSQLLEIRDEIFQLRQVDMDYYHQPVTIMEHAEIELSDMTNLR